MKLVCRSQCPALQTKLPANGITDKSPQAVQSEDQNDNLGCSVAVEQDMDGESVFTVRIRGAICADKAGRRVTLSVIFDDLTDGPSQITAVYTKPIEGYSPGPKQFEYICDLGRLNDIETQIPDWLSVARIKAAMIAFSRRGTRRLRLKGSVICRETGSELARCCSTFQYENPEYGYVDVAENIERGRALAVTLAFSLCAADGKMYKSEVEKIKQWAYSHIQPQSSRQTQVQLDNALRKTVRFFKRGYKINTLALAEELTQIVPAAERYDMIEMCLSVVASKGFVSAGQIELLKNLAAWLEIDSAKFRDMVEQLAPANMHQVKDMELIFGLGEQMNREQTRQRLNNEYRKWNARVTNVDPAIQTQAEQMLNLIAQARNHYIG